MGGRLDYGRNGGRGSPRRLLLDAWEVNTDQQAGQGLMMVMVMEMMIMVMMNE